MPPLMKRQLESLSFGVVDETYELQKSIGAISLVVAALLLGGCDMVLMDPKGAVGVKQKS